MSKSITVPLGIPEPKIDGGITRERPWQSKRNNSGKPTASALVFWAKLSANERKSKVNLGADDLENGLPPKITDTLI